ncbi:unnamed protein product, partial [Rotaria socialis]
MDLKKYFDCLCENEDMDVGLIRSYTYQILDALLFCHCRRIIHRDLK